MGANLAVGGAVVGDCIQCPFHLWEFAGDGKVCPLSCLALRRLHAFFLGGGGGLNVMSVSLRRPWQSLVTCDVLFLIKKQLLLLSPTCQCEHIPYADVPSAAKTKAYPVVEWCGVICFYFDAEGRDPPYPLPDDLPICACFAPFFLICLWFGSLLACGWVWG